MAPKAEKKTAKTTVFRHCWQAWKVVRLMAAVRQRPRTPRNWRCSFAFFESFLWHFNEKQRTEVIFRLSRPVSCKNQENGAGKQWSFHAPLKRLGFQWPPPSIKRIQTEITTVFFVCVFVFALCKSWTVCSLFRHNEKLEEKRWERLRKKLASSTTAFGFWTECDIGLWTESDLYFFLSASARRPLHMRGRKGGRTSSRFTRISDGSFGRRLQALRDARSVSELFLSKSLQKVIGPFSIAAKRRKCIHVWRRKENRLWALSWRSSAFPLLVVSSCFCRLYGGPACIWPVASNAHFFFERLQRANRSQVDHCKQWNMRPLNTTTNSGLHPKHGLLNALKGWEKNFHTHALTDRSPNHHLARCAHSVVIWQPALLAGNWNFKSRPRQPAPALLHANHKGRR